MNILNKCKDANIHHLRKHQEHKKFKENERQWIVDTLIEMKNGHYGNGLFVKHENRKHLGINENFAKIENGQFRDLNKEDKNIVANQLLGKNVNKTEVLLKNTISNNRDGKMNKVATNGTSGKSLHTKRTSVFGPLYSQMAPGNRRIPSGTLIYLRHLSRDYDALYMYRLFSQYGNVLRVDFLNGCHGNYRDGYAFVSMYRLPQAQLAVRDIDMMKFGDIKVNIQVSQL